MKKCILCRTAVEKAVPLSVCCGGKRKSQLVTIYNSFLCEGYNCFSSQVLIIVVCPVQFHAYIEFLKTTL